MVHDGGCHPPLHVGTHPAAPADLLTWNEERGEHQTRSSGQQTEVKGFKREDGEKKRA